jgi:hypothetical protein
MYLDDNLGFTNLSPLIMCMKPLLRLMTIFFVSSILMSSGCGKGSGGGGTPPPPPPPPPPTEADLVVTTTPAVGSVQPPTNGPFDLTVTITSTMPPSGVKIVVNARKDDGTNPAPFFTTTVNTSTSVNNFSITNTPAATQCIVDITVTSLTKATNVWSGVYRYSRK